MEEIARKLRKQGVTIRRIAEILQVGSWTVQQWCKGIKPELPERVCEYESCSKPFHPSRKDQRFCCQGCKGQNKHLQRQTDRGSLGGTLTSVRKPNHAEE